MLYCAMNGTAVPTDSLGNTSVERPGMTRLARARPGEEGTCACLYGFFDWADFAKRTHKRLVHNSATL